jgi:hypothetical protein
VDYKRENRHRIVNVSHKLYCDRSITNDGTVQNSRPDRVVFDKAIKEAYLIHVTMPNSHNLHSTTTEKFQKYAAPRRRPNETVATARGLCSAPNIIHNWYYPQKLHDSLRLPILRPVLLVYVLM